MISKITASISFKARKELKKAELNKEIIKQLPAHGKLIKSIIKVTNEEPCDYLLIRQGDEVTTFVSKFVENKLTEQFESYNNEKSVSWIIKEDGSRERKD